MDFWLQINEERAKLTTELLVVYSPAIQEFADSIPAQNKHLSAGTCLFVLSLGVFYAYVRSTTHLTIHLQFDLSANVLVIKAIQGPKCLMCC
jgi:hypothetical protein